VKTRKPLPGTKAAYYFITRSSLCIGAIDGSRQRLLDRSPKVVSVIGFDAQAVAKLATEALHHESREVLDAWRSQDQAPLYGVDEGRLQQALREEVAKRRRGLVIEARITDGFAALVFAGLALVFALMLYDDDPRTWWDFLIVTLGVAAAVFAAANLYIGRTRLAPRVRHFGASLHHELGRHVALRDYELSRTWRVSAITRTMLPFYLCTLALYLSIWRINNEPFRT
jgi:hypothetical protein